MECFTVSAESCAGINSRFSGSIKWEESSDGAVLIVDSAKLLEVLSALRDEQDLRFEMLIDVTAVDFPERACRFDVVYHLLSVVKNIRLRVKVRLEDGEKIPSAMSVFSSASWFEREVWDMYGIDFSGHSDLRRILTDYEFEGHPLRKDFPLTGYKEVRYDHALQKVVYEPVKLEQAFRSFDFMSPWEGAEYILPPENNVAKS